MASYYVWSGAAGTGTGASWANAYTTLSLAFSCKSAGDVFYVATDPVGLARDRDGRPTDALQHRGAILEFRYTGPGDLHQSRRQRAAGQRRPAYYGDGFDNWRNPASVRRIYPL